MPDKHIRAEFRKEIKTRLTGLPGMLNTPISGLQIPADQTELPVVAISYGNEEIERLKAGSDDKMIQVRLLNLTISLAAFNPDDLDVILAETERRMEVPIMSGVSHRLLGTENNDPNPAEWVFYSSVLTYVLKYSTLAGEPWRLAP